jgi:N-acetylmuramic acid 6-phosphate (MurNAc-6-P) etherase
LLRTPNIAVNVIGSREIVSSSYKDYKTAFDHSTTKFMRKSSLIIGNSNEVADYMISCSPVSSVLNLMEHLAVKLVLNTISTGTMVLMGRVTDNWMSWVEVSNKKLKDRGIRLISDICGISYRDACYALHETLGELKTINLAENEKFSPVQYTIKKIRDKGKVKK